MKRNRQITVRPFRITSYVLLFLMDMVLLAVLRNYFFWLIAIVMVICPVLSIVAVNALAHRIQLVIRSSQERSVKDGMVWIEVALVNPCWYGALDCRVPLTVKNVFLETESVVTLSMPVRSRGESTLQLPVKGKEMGNFSFGCDRIVIQDLLGMVCRVVKVQAETDFTVLPDREKIETIEVSGFLSGVAETEESRKKGSDFSEVSEIREYIPGDKIRDIHWKLSAKQEKLMVKERVAVAGSEMVLLMKLTGNRQKVQSVLEKAYSLCHAFAAVQLPVRLLCWDQNRFSFVEYLCGDAAETDNTFCDIFRLPLSGYQNEEQQNYLKNCYPFLNRYLMVWEQEGTVQLEMCEND